MVTQLHTIIQTYTYFTHLDIAGNFLSLTNVPRISGREWVPTCPYSPSEPFFLIDYTQS